MATLAPAAKLTPAQKAKITRDANRKAKADAIFEQERSAQKKREFELDDVNRKRVYSEAKSIRKDLDAAVDMFENMLDAGVPINVATKVHERVSAHILTPSGSVKYAIWSMDPVRNDCDVKSELAKYGINSVVEKNRCEFVIEWNYEVRQFDKKWEAEAKAAELPLN
jgi:hypothetical protein